MASIRPRLKRTAARLFEAIEMSRCDVRDFTGS